MLTAAQKALRMSGIGASEIGVIAGLSKYARPIDVWRRKMGLVADPMTFHQRLGHALEPVIAQLYAEDHVSAGERVVLPSEAWPDAVDGTLRHPEHSWMLASPDRAVMVDDRVVRLVEIKTASHRAAWQWGDASDAVPPAYRAQIEWQMAVTGVHVCDLTVLLEGSELRVYRIEHDPELLAMLEYIGRGFWGLVERKEQPEIDGSEGWSKHLADRFPVQRGPIREAAPHEAETVRSLVEIDRLVKKLEASRKLLENNLKQAIGHDDGIESPEARVTWRLPKSGTVAWKAVAEALGSAANPEIVTANTSAPSRRFTVTPHKDSSE